MFRDWVGGYIDPDTGEKGHAPNPKQLLAHLSTADWLFYGGQVGGGKSEYLIVEAILTCIEFAGCECAIFRRKSTELYGSENKI